MADTSWHQSGTKIVIGKNTIQAHCRDCANKIMVLHRKTEDETWDQAGKYIYWATRHFVGATTTFQGARLLVDYHNEKVLLDKEKVKLS